MIDEPYRWLEAVANRREYIRDQLKGATPVFAFSRPEGILLVGWGSGQSKVFEIYDRLALGALGHPVDIEKIRQTIIEAAHLEGFTRSPEDVTLRRMLSFSLGPALKNSFEQILAAPIIAECVFAELGDTPEHDVLARVAYDGTYRFERGGVAVVHTSAADESAAADWLRAHATAGGIGDVVQLAWQARAALVSGQSFVPPAEGAVAPPVPEGLVLECGLLDRRATGRARYRSLEPSELS